MVIRTLAQCTESFVFYNTDFLSDIRAFHAGYKNMLLDSEHCL